MKTIKVYTINELSEDVRNKVLERESDINAYHDWWQGTYEDFIQIAKLFGYELESKDISFSGFCSQGDGASFVCKYVYLDKWKLAHKSIKALKEYAPTDKVLHTLFQSVSREIKSFKGWKVEDESVLLYRSGHHYAHKYTISAELNDDNETTPENIDKAVLEEARDLMQWLYDALEREYYYLISKEAILETLESNEYKYTESGIMV